MQLFLALSCLQGRPMQEAFDELAALDVEGLQLTPGNAPTSGFAEHVRRHEGRTRTHHGFSPNALRVDVWDAQGQLKGRWDSVHPPRAAGAAWRPIRQPMCVSRPCIRDAR